MSHQSTYEIRFDDILGADASAKAKELREAILDADSSTQVTIKKDDQSNMDFGATLVLVLGAPAAVAVAKGIADCLRRIGGSVTVSENGTVVVKNINGKDAADIVKALSKKSA